MEKMSGKFEGFTQEDINKISAKPKRGLFATKPMLLGRGIRRVPDKKSMTSATSATTTMVQANNIKNNNENNMKVIGSSATGSNDSPIDYDRKISDESLTTLQEAVHFRPLSMKNKKIESPNIIHQDNSEVSDESIINLDKIKYNGNRNNDDSSILPDNNKQEFFTTQQMSPFRGVSLKDFEIQRKLREEQNKQKKEILYKAIEKHTQKTTAEVKKIEEIKNELSKLDHDLASDVSILRKQIESACIQYSSIEKQYNKIEQMFLKAKLDLHNASEKKELLTEHLCTVITHNEDRKAKKLTELMEKVGLTPSGEYQIEINKEEKNSESVDK